MVTMKKEILKYLAGRFIPAVVNLAVIILAIRFIGPTEYGKYSLIYSAVIIAITLSYHWVQVSIQRFLGSMPKDSETVIGRFFDMTLITAMAATILILLFGWFYFRLNLWELAILALATFLAHLYLYYQAIFQAYHRTFRSALLEGVDQIIILAVLIVGLFLIRFDRAMLLIAAMAAGYAVVMVFRLFLRIRGLHTSDIRHFYWDSRFSGKVMEFGLGMALWLLFAQLLVSVDRFILAEYLGLKDTGIYSAAKDLVYKGVAFSIFPIYTSYQSKIGDEWNARHKIETWTKVKEAISFEMLIFIIIFIAFMVVKTSLFNDLLRLPELNNWLIYLPVLMAAFIWQIVLLFQRFLELTIKSKFVLWMMSITVLLNIVLNLIFIPLFGLAGSAVALFISSLFYAAGVFLRCLLVCRNIEQ
jgi:O-antigen/teichoic acid export membrane protein